MEELASFEQSGSVWVPKVYRAVGSWAIIAGHDGLTLALGDDFGTSPGPDLKLYATTLSMASIGDRDPVDQSSDYIAELASPSGAQRYPLPAADFGAYNAILIHCTAYSVVWCGVDINV